LSSVVQARSVFTIRHWYAVISESRPNSAEYHGTPASIDGRPSSSSDRSIRRSRMARSRNDDSWVFDVRNRVHRFRQLEYSCSSCSRASRMGRRGGAVSPTDGCTSTATSASPPDGTRRSNVAHPASRREGCGENRIVVDRPTPSRPR
jgi:hypothetical protein